MLQRYCCNICIFIGIFVCLNSQNNVTSKDANFLANIGHQPNKSQIIRGRITTDVDLPCSLFKVNYIFNYFLL